MNFLTFENVTKTYGPKVLFRDISLSIDKGQKIALIAKNGTGKSTLLRVLAGIEGAEGESAKILFRKDIRVGYLPQEPELDPGHTAIEAIFASDTPLIQAVSEYENALLFPDDHDRLQRAMVKMEDMKAWDFEAKVKEILFKLSIRHLDQRIGTFSGGQIKRIALAKLLIEEPDFLILDEPTNHLDVDMIEWLENYLSHPGLTLFMVTHDRYFLDNVCNHIIELEGGKFYRYKGNYTEYLDKKAIRDEVDANTLDKGKKLLSRELEWMRRTPAARTTKAKSRIDDFYDLKDKTSVRKDRSEVQIDIKSSRLGSKILELQYITKGYGDRVLIRDFHHFFKKNERVGIVGPNGTGKSTLLKLITGLEAPDKGKIVTGETVVFGHYGQEGLQLKEDKRVIEVITDIAEFIPLEKGQKLTAASLLERFLFTREQQQVYASQLSGGEKRRLYLLTVLMKNPNFLILDEPTNDLDIMTLNVLEEFLQDFPGCLIIVTHDRYFMDKLVDHLFIFEGDSNIRDYNGNYTEYREWRKIKNREDKQLENQQLKAAEKLKDDRPKRSYQEKKELDQIEKEIPKLERRKKEILHLFNMGDLTPAEAASLSVELGEVQTTLEEKEMRWLELSE
jgi:ATP-binding cassette subfamily F protein uup